jgi:serine/threonine protein kinase
MIRGEKLGEGTFGIVYEAHSPSTDNKYAIKRNLAEDDTSFIGVPREVDVLTKLRNHPNIICIERISFGHPFATEAFSPITGDDRKSQRDDSIHFIFSKANCDLHEFIYGTRINFTLIKKYMVHMLLGLEYMHLHKIIHRDMKPSNVLLFDDVAKICDFGLAKPFTYQGDQTPDTVTSWYRAPEIALGYPHYDFKSDVWSMGCIFYEMMAKKSFIHNNSDNNDSIVSHILGALPEELPMRKMRELVKSNKWRNVKLSPIHNPKQRKTFEQKIKLSAGGVKNFEKNTASTTTLFYQLLNHMLTFDWNERFTTTQCLDHEFFNDYKDHITKTRTTYEIKKYSDHPMIVKKCNERTWMSKIVIEIFNNRKEIKWYTHRIMFQAMDLFDRYLSVMFHTTEIPENALESEDKGFIHSKFDTELRFMTCIYLCIKYFSSIQYPISYESVVLDEYKTDSAKIIAEQFEGGFIKNCLEYNIYRDTVYEIADEFDDMLDDAEIRDLIIIYSMNPTFNTMTPSQLYKYYKENMKGKEVDYLMNHVIKSTI